MTAQQLYAQQNLQHRANMILQQQQQQQKQQAQVAATQQSGRATPAIPMQSVGRGGAMNPRISPMPGTPQMQQMHPVQAAQHATSQMNFSSYNTNQLRSMINPQLAAAALAAAQQQQQQHHLPTSGQPHLLHHQQQQTPTGQAPGGVESQQPQPVSTPPQQGQMSHQYVYPYGFSPGQTGTAPQRIPQYWHNGLSTSSMRIPSGMMPGQPMVTNAQHVQAIQQQLQARGLAGGIVKGPSPMPQGNPAMQGR